MAARAEARRAVRRQSTVPLRGETHVEPEPLVVAPSLGQQIVAVLLALGCPLALALFLFNAATTPGKGEQVAPVLSIAVGVLFGIPMMFLLYRHLRRVFDGGF